MKRQECEHSLLHLNLLTLFMCTYIAYKMMCVCRFVSQSHSEYRLLFLFVCGLFVYLISISFTRTASFFVLCICCFCLFFFFCQVLHVVEFEQCSVNQLYASLVVALLRPAGSANNIKESVSDIQVEANSR